MDMHDDPDTANTTTTTDYDSGDSEGIDYVYEGQPILERTIKAVKAKSPRRRKSPKSKPSRSTPHKCTCGAAGVDDDDEITVFEEPSDSESDSDVDGDQHSQPSKPSCSTPECTSRCHERRHRVERRKGAEKKLHHRRPYIEEYPDEPNRPLIVLKEHKVPRRASTSDARRILALEDAALPSAGSGSGLGSGSRGRSPTGKRLSQWAREHSQSAKAAHKHSAHSKRRSAAHEASDAPSIFPVDDMDPPPASDRRSRLTTTTRATTARNSEPSWTSRPHDDLASPGAPTPTPMSRHLTNETRPEMASTVARHTPLTQPSYSSSWPLHAGTQYLQQSQRNHRDAEYDSDDESEHAFNKDENFDEFHRLRRRSSVMDDDAAVDEFRRLRRRGSVLQSVDEDRVRRIPQRPRAPSFREREMQLSQQQQPERPRPRQRSRAPTLNRKTSTATIKNNNHQYSRGAPSIVPTELCEVWRGCPEDWESPYASSDIESDGEPVARLLILEGTPPPRTSSPQLLPPMGSREHFAFSSYGGDALSRAPSPTPPPFRRPHLAADDFNLWDASFDVPAAPPSVAPSRLSRVSRRWTYPGPVIVAAQAPAPPPPPSMAARARSRGRERGTARASTPRIVFSARQTKEMLSPVPMRAAKFDFDAWDCARASRGSLHLGGFV